MAIVPREEACEFPYCLKPVEWVWVTSNPERYPLCQTHKEMLGRIVGLPGEIVRIEEEMTDAS